MKAVDAYILALPAERAGLITYLLTTIKAVSPLLKERISYGIPFIYYRKYLCYLNCTKQGVDVGFAQGNKLQPRPELIVGTRKVVRSVLFTWEDEVDTELLRKLVEESMHVQDRDWKRPKK